MCCFLEQLVVSCKGCVAYFRAADTASRFLRFVNTDDLRVSAEIGKALNTVLAFVSSKNHLATTFPVIRSSVEGLLKRFVLCLLSRGARVNLLISFDEALTSFRCR
jgi:hypothetical protein